MIYGHLRDGNISRLFKSFKKYPLFPILGDGRSKVQPIYIGDVVGAVVRALECAETLNKTYDIAGPIPITYRDLLETVAKILGRRILFVHLPLGVAAALVRVLSAFKISPVSVEQVLRLTENKNVDIAPAKSDFGFEPTAFEKGLQWGLLDMEREAWLLKSETAT
jgi:nucleoside-diphosphate-sugar epimerase